MFQAFTSAPAAAWRRELVGSQEKRRPCDTCAAGVLQKPEELNAFSEAHRRYVTTPETAVVSG
jgi:hypothetical protein